MFPVSLDGALVSLGNMSLQVIAPGGALGYTKLHCVALLIA